MRVHDGDFQKHLRPLYGVTVLQPDLLTSKFWKKKKKKKNKKKKV